MNIAVGIACLVAVTVPGAVTGFPDKLLENEKRIKENDKLSILQDDEIERQAKVIIDKPACRIIDGQCQNINDFCAGEIRTGSLWCSRSRKYGCCIPPPPCDCEIDGKVYPNGRVAENRCIYLLCNNGTWEYYDWNDDCGLCYAFGKKGFLHPYVSHNISHHVINKYNIGQHDGTYVFSQSGLSSATQLEIDITLEHNDIYNESCITDVFYAEPGLTIEICLINETAVVLVNDYPYTILGSSLTAFPIAATFGTVFIIFEYGVWPDYGEIYIVGSQGFSVNVYFNQSSYDVLAMAMPSMYGQLYGLCDVFPPLVPLPYPEYWTMSNGGVTNNTHAFIKSWELPLSGRSLTNKVARQKLE